MPFALWQCLRFCRAKHTLLSATCSSSLHLVAHDRITCRQCRWHCHRNARHAHLQSVAGTQTCMLAEYCMRMRHCTAWHLTPRQRRISIIRHNTLAQCTQCAAWVVCVQLRSADVHSAEKEIVVGSRKAVCQNQNLRKNVAHHQQERIGSSGQGARHQPVCSAVRRLL